MTRSKTAKMAQIMQAFADGKGIEYRMRSEPQDESLWVSIGNPIWNWDRFDYRVAKKLIERWAIVRCDENGNESLVVQYTTRDIAIDSCMSMCHGKDELRIAHLKEVDHG